VPELLRSSVVFRRYWSAHTVSLLGDQISMLALPLVAVLALDADADDMGYLTAAALAPNFLFALHVGVWVDPRGRRRRVMIGADLGRAALVLTVPLAYALDVLTLEQLTASRSSSARSPSSSTWPTARSSSPSFPVSGLSRRAHS